MPCRDGTQEFMNTRQGLYHLSYNFQPLNQGFKEHLKWFVEEEEEEVTV